MEQGRRNKRTNIKPVCDLYLITFNKLPQYLLLISLGVSSDLHTSSLGAHQNCRGARRRHHPSLQLDSLETKETKFTGLFLLEGLEVLVNDRHCK
ncbi:hypothetical protein OIU76_019370 [Salix suchowensis]|nr:hypothetical protein OIU76_019370 [Salix suchowensis]KAJ6314317.1 hypothetical protein OIU78_017896 [Salix suchowensis]